ncbi:hypothetical protein [Rubrivivax albus]|nr:hypothetical protein [Rubrivivax albus]
MQALDVRKLQRQRLLTLGNSLTWSWSVNGETCAAINLLVGFDRVTLNYRTRERGGDWRPMRYPVQMTWTACNYGGRRAWWLCPALGCGRRVAVLYGGTVFACRHCHRLAYRVQRETDDDRAARRADSIRRRLGWEPGILNGNGLKPKGMHWRTFERLQAEHDEHVGVALAGMAGRLGLLSKLTEALRPP